MIEFLTHRVEVLKLSKEIGEQTQGKIDERQREYILREQLKTIKKELGEDETRGRARRAAARRSTTPRCPRKSRKQAAKELRRLENMPEASTEHSMVRTYLDWLVALPWSKLDEENIDIAKAREILDADHYGLDKVKRRILEYLAVRKLNAKGRSPILCFVGPPGVGKTSLGQSIARALGLKFVRSSLGGVHDEAEIRGHRRTYIGSLPGNIMQSLRKAGTRNPVFMLDEMDKLGVGFHGDPSAALLEVLDPEQNSTFRDHYLDVPFDLCKVLFVGTANVLENIPGAAPRPHGDHRAAGLHAGREARDRDALPRAAPARRRTGSKAEQVVGDRGRDRGRDRRLHARGRRAQPRARHRRAAAPRRDEDRRRHGGERRDRHGRRARRSSARAASRTR